MKIALVGYGKMGQEVASVIKEAGVHEIVSISYKSQTDALDTKGIALSDVAIDFTAPSVAVDNITHIAKLGKNIVVGTTGWYDQIPHIKKIVSENNIGLLYGQNFSIGANIFFHIIAHASKLFYKFGGYDVYGLEVHHAGKKDSPSGTAKKIADTIMEHFPSKKRLQNSSLDRQIEQNELHFASIRGGRNPGYHEVIFDSAADSIALSHSAHSRRGFAQGAIMAAEFIEKKKGLHTFDELFRT